MNIIPGNFSNPAVIALLSEHLRGLAEHSPPESMHALTIEGLAAPGITFWTAWENDELLGCGALKELDPKHGEIKSMRTVKAHLGKGVGSGMLRHIIDESMRRSYRRLSLETGSGEAFIPAFALYEKFGFVYCGPFADYREDPFSRFMTLELARMANQS
jgi:putative acetyltransferase